jgi:hypothetical protein
MQNELPNLSNLSLSGPATHTRGANAGTLIGVSLLSVDGMNGIHIRYHEAIAREIHSERQQEVVAGEVEEDDTSVDTSKWIKVTDVPKFGNKSKVSEMLTYLNDKRYMGKKSLIVYGGKQLEGTFKNETTFEFQSNNNTNQDTAQEILYNISNNKADWYVAVDTASHPVEAQSSESHRTKRPRTYTPPLPPPAPPNELTLKQEYDAHCAWLRLILQPSEVSRDANGVLGVDAITDGDSYTQLLTLIASVEATLRTSWFVKTSVERVIADIMVTTKNLNNAELKPPKFKKLDNKDAEEYIKWIKLHMLSKTGTIYQYLGINDENPQIDGLSVEHITPKSWTRATQLLREFHDAALDPVTLASAAKNANASRNNSPLGFSRMAPNSTWTPAGRWHVAPMALQLRKYAARAVVYSSLTYPLLSSNVDGTFVVRANSPEMAPSPGGVNAYAAQFDKIIELATSDPEEWEIEIAARCWLQFGVLNPLLVSKKNRDEVKDSNSHIHKLLRARFGGWDLSGAACLRTLQTVISNFS